MSGTTSSSTLYATLRTQLLTTPDASGTVLNTLLGGTNLPGATDGRLYSVAVPDNSPYPFGVMKLINRATVPARSYLEEQAELEVLFYGRPYSMLPTLENLANVADGAMLWYVDATGGGLVFGGTHRRDSMRQLPDPADREVAIVRCVYGLTLYPSYLALHPTP